MSSETSPFFHPPEHPQSISTAKEHTEALCRIHRLGGRFKFRLSILGHCWYRSERMRIQRVRVEEEREDVGALVCALSRPESTSRWEARAEHEKE